MFDLSQFGSQCNECGHIHFPDEPCIVDWDDLLIARLGSAYRPCSYRLPRCDDEAECVSTNCRLAAAELEWAQLKLGVPFAIL